MINNLPEELILEIFYKLPIKSLVQCTCVSKSWLSLIKNPCFIATHLNLTINKNNSLLIFRLRPEQYALHLDNHEFDPYMRLKLPFKTKTGKTGNFPCKGPTNFREIGTCNGLICLEHSSSAHVEKTIVLWNPAIKKTLTIPKPNITDSMPYPRGRDPYKTVYGFGFDSSTNDYKLVKILNNFQTAESAEVPVPEAQIFSLKRNSWRTVTEILPKYNITVQVANILSLDSYSWGRTRMRTLTADSVPKYSHSQAFVNGGLHRLAFGKGRNGNGFWNFILRLDMSGEVFREIMLPESLVHVIPNSITTSVYKKSSSIGVFFTNPGENLDVWVMKEYGDEQSWTKIWSIAGEYLPLGFRKDGEVFLESTYGSIVLFDPKSEEEIVVGDREDGKYSFFDSFYVESLVLLNNANAVSGTNVLILQVL